MQRLSLFILLTTPALVLAGIVTPPVPVPEPSTLALFVGGFAAIGLIRYLKNKNK